MSAEETVLFNLFDSYWFEQRFFAFAPQKPYFSTAAAPILQEKIADEPQLNRITTLMRKSYSDHDLSSKDLSSEPSSPSPKSVLGPQLQTILSGKEVESFDESSPPPKSGKIETSVDAKAERARDRRRRRRKSGASKSLTELEVEELKGFMDLGFVFSDEDRDSKLVSIIPGLQRLGKESERSVSGIDETTSAVARPYLSEAWDCMEERAKNPLMDWRIPAFGNEMELKDHLRFWAHSVASAVR